MNPQNLLQQAKDIPDIGWIALVAMGVLTVILLFVRAIIKSQSSSTTIDSDTEGVPDRRWDDIDEKPRTPKPEPPPIKEKEVSRSAPKSIPRPTGKRLNKKPALIGMSLLVIVTALSAWLYITIAAQIQDARQGTAIIPPKEYVEKHIQTPVQPPTPEETDSHEAEKTVSKAEEADLRAMLNEGIVKLRKRDHFGAETVFRYCLAQVSREKFRSSPLRSTVYARLAMTLEQVGQADEAEVYYIRALATVEESGERASPNAAIAKAGLARIRGSQGRFQAVAPLYEEAIVLWDEILGPGNGNSVALMLELAAFLDRIEHKKEALTLREKALSFDSIQKDVSSLGMSKVGPDVVMVSVSAGRHFNPVRSSSRGPNGAWMPGTDKISPTRPLGIHQEPAYLGQMRRYGRLDLGVPKKTYFFALDRSTGPHPVLYLDRNRNGDLSDDGPPTINQGRGFFAAQISLPAADLMEEYSGAQDFHIWFYLSEKDWDRGVASHYSQTQMWGHILVGKNNYSAWLAETKRNDGDFTNDGIYLDIDGDGKIESGTEYVGSGQTLKLDGTAYRFIITP